MERFFRSLKNEWMPVVGYVSFSEAAHAITDYIVGYDSALRPHEYNGGFPPNESENQYWKTLTRWPVFVDHFSGAEKWLRYVIEHIQDWPANRVRDLLPWIVELTAQ